MDTTEEYILMCKSAEEIQDYYITKHKSNLKIGDIVYVRSINDIATVYAVYATQKGHWLPRQDQLQDLCNTTPELKLSSVSLIAMFSHWIFQSGLKVHPEVTMEQLWLMYFMQDRYDKQWDSKNNQWI